MKQNFTSSLAATLKYEGGYSNHPADPGGATMKGVTQRVYDAWRRKNGLPSRSVRQLSQSELEAIYRRDYWDRCRCDDLPSGVDLVVFDYAVNSGPSRAIKCLQTVVGVSADGIVGPRTIAASKAAGTIERICSARMAFVQRLKTFSTFGKGWTARINDVKRKGLAMAKAVPNEPEETSVFDDVLDTIDWTRPHAQRPPAIQKDALHGEKTKIASAVIAALGALSVLDWNAIIQSPRTGYAMIISALIVSVGHVYLPQWLWWALPKEKTA